MERSLTGTVMDFIMRKKVQLRSDIKLAKKTDGLREFLQKKPIKLKGPQNPKVCIYQWIPNTFSYGDLRLVSEPCSRTQKEVRLLSGQ